MSTEYSPISPTRSPYLPPEVVSAACCSHHEHSAILSTYPQAMMHCKCCIHSSQCHTLQSITTESDNHTINSCFAQIFITFSRTKMK